VERSLHHHGGVREQVDALSGHLALTVVTPIGIVRHELLSKPLHHSVDNLALAWQPEALQYCFERNDEWHVLQIVLVDELRQTVPIEWLVHAEELSDDSLAQSRRCLQEVNYSLHVALIVRFWARHKLQLLKLLNPELPFAIEFLRGQIPLLFDVPLLLQVLELIGSFVCRIAHRIIGYHSLVFALAITTCVRVVLTRAEVLIKAFGVVVSR